MAGSDLPSSSRVQRNALVAGAVAAVVAVATLGAWGSGLFLSEEPRVSHSEPASPLTTATEAEATPTGRLVHVLMVNAAIERGESLEYLQQTGRVELDTIKTDFVVPGALSSTDPVTGTVALIPLQPGDQLTAAALGDPKDADLPGLGVTDTMLEELREAATRAGHTGQAGIHLMALLAVAHCEGVSSGEDTWRARLPELADQGFPEERTEMMAAYLESDFCPRLK